MQEMRNGKTVDGGLLPALATKTLTWAAGQYYNLNSWLNAWVVLAR